MRTPLLALALVACGGSSDSATTPTGGFDPDDPRYDRATWPTEVGTTDRPAAVEFPSTYTPGDELPVIVLLHGFGASALLQEFVYHLGDRVDSGNFILLLPDGTVNPDGSRFWNATPQCCDFYGSDVDDVAYLNSLLDELEATMPVDPDRILVTGHSNGGYMSYRMACESSERIAAIAPLAGSTFRDEADCNATSPVSVLAIHGTEDADVAYEDDGWAAGAQASLERWTDRAGCTGSTVDPAKRNYEAIVDGKETTVTTYDGCTNGFTGEFWSMADVGHLPGFTEAWRDDLVTWLLAQRNI